MKKQKRKRRVCIPNVFLDVGRYKGTGIEVIQDSVASREGRNSEICLSQEMERGERR